MVLRKRSATGLGRADITAHSVRKTRSALSAHRGLTRHGTFMKRGRTISCRILAINAFNRKQLDEAKSKQVLGGAGYVYTHLLILYLCIVGLMFTCNAGCQ